MTAPVCSRTEATSITGVGVGTGAAVACSSEPPQATETNHSAAIAAT